MKPIASRLALVAVAAVVLAVLAVGRGQQAAVEVKVAAKAAAQARKPPATQPVDKAFAAFAKTQSVPCVKVQVVKEAPKVDGVLDPVYKKKATPLTLKFIAGGQAKPTAATTVYVLTTQAELVVFFDCASPDMAALLADVREHDGDVWNDDSVELFIDPTNKRQLDGYMHMIVNSVATTCESKGPQGNQDKSWNPKLKVKTKVGKKGWTVELAIPLKELVKDVKKINRVWAVNFNRMAYLIEGTEDTAWSPTGQTSSHVPAKFGCLWLDLGKVDNTKEKK